MRKSIQQLFQPLRLLTQGASVQLSTPWILQPTQGRRNAQVGKGYSAFPGVMPSVEWAVFAGVQSDLGKLQATVTITVQSLDGAAPPYSSTIDVSGDLVLYQGRLTMALPHSPLCQLTLQLTSRSTGENVSVFVTQTVCGRFAPHHAPAENEDSFGYGIATVNPAVVRDANLAGNMPSMQPEDDPATWDTGEDWDGPDQGPAGSQ